LEKLAALPRLGFGRFTTQGPLETRIAKENLGRRDAQRHAEDFGADGSHDKRILELNQPMFWKALSSFL